MVRRDREVAQHLQDVAAADGHAVDRGDDRLRDVADQAVERLDLEDAALGRAVVAGLQPLLLVAARAEGPLPGARQRHHSHRPIGPRQLERADQLVDRATAERVVTLRPVDRDPGQAALDLVEDIFHGLIVAGVPARRSADRSRSAAAGQYRLRAGVDPDASPRGRVLAEGGRQRPWFPQHRVLEIFCVSPR